MKNGVYKCVVRMFSGNRFYVAAYKRKSELFYRLSKKVRIFSFSGKLSTNREKFVFRRCCLATNAAMKEHFVCGGKSV